MCLLQVVNETENIFVELEDNSKMEMSEKHGSRSLQFFLKK